MKVLLDELFCADFLSSSFRLSAFSLLFISLYMAFSRLLMNCSIWLLKFYSEGNLTLTIL
jgi:hypothetical protein